MSLKRVIICVIVMCSSFLSSCSSSDASSENVVDTPKENETPDEGEAADAPPKLWREHWFEHNQLVTRVYYDDDLALYYDNDVDRTIEWPKTILSDVWEYIKSVYGNFGEDPRLYAILHTGRYSGGHPSVYMDASHDYRNVVDCGPYSWRQALPQEGLNLIIHEVGHIVEGSTNGIKNNPAWDIWKDSKWAEIFIYDVYKGIGKDSFAQQFHDEMLNQYDDFPRPDTQWFKDWFYPVYTQYGESKVLNNFYDLLAEHFPKNNQGTAFSRRMDMGEFVHFWSGAAGEDLQPLAKEAFGWPTEWENQLTKAKETFPQIQY
ncbi:hypothetical protein LZ575_18165 [Antarcticibacterium sp. 1MA-6-2]|uniref:hypothetical protein n=1 Tax=Antarcticibacterium sp. 1MA-6-2 TaxID=2908210 RepID=UPI001F3BB9E4|nr:hypothetical protein [Antarcticibacterium sp. 1MA-6-2]UJH90672.1 hypothetical protein LZ575_18165 [Antarcticibacterium sp. 1MA-6-2]